VESTSFLAYKNLIRIFVILLLGILLLIGIRAGCFFSKHLSSSQSIVIARHINWNDFDFTGKELNVQAFAEELVLAAGKEANLRIQFVPANPNTLLEDLRAGNYDAVFTFMVPNSLNRQTYIFSHPLYELGSVLVVDEKSDAHRLEDMDGKIVGIIAGTSSIYDVSRYPSIILVTYESVNAALENLKNDRIDGVIMDIWHAQMMIHSFYDNKLKIATGPLSHQGLRLVSLGHPKSKEFIKFFNEGLARVKEKGLYKQLIQKWGLYDSP
jgi:polar amino acid transport system substrate-binding protein